MKVKGFFSGIGGFELGFQRAGFEVESVCEIDTFCNQVLAKHWPKVPNLGDIRSLSEASLARICPSPGRKQAEKALAAGCIASILPSSLRKDLNVLSRRMSATLGVSGWWAIEPNVGRVAHGVPRRVDRLRGLGNAVIPHIVQIIAEGIKAVKAISCQDNAE